MDPKPMIAHLDDTKKYFDRSTACLTEDDSSFAPAEGMHTAAQQVAHVAWTIDWFREGAFRPEGFDMDFEKEAAALRGVTSLTAARAEVDRAFAALKEKLAASTPEELDEPLPAGPVMGGEPRFAIVAALADHTAHHRGALTVYSRLRGHTPALPYM